MNSFDESELRKSAQAGNADAQMELAKALWRTELPDKQAEAIDWFARAAQMGSSEHRRIFGSLLCWEPGPFQDFDRGFALLNESAQMGNVSAQYAVAAELAVGEHVSRDPRSAAEWYARAADAGCAEAAYNLATMYIEGDGVPVDKERALELLEGAASAGELLALRALTEGYESGANGLPVDPAKGATWRARYEAARKSSSTSSQ
jgi:hypothetical protein